jgi:hypothetical protein
VLEFIDSIHATTMPHIAELLTTGLQTSNRRHIQAALKRLRNLGLWCGNVNSYDAVLFPVAQKALTNNTLDPLLSLPPVTLPVDYSLEEIGYAYLSVGFWLYVHKSVHSAEYFSIGFAILHYVRKYYGWKKPNITQAVKAAKILMTKRTQNLPRAINLVRRHWQVNQSHKNCPLDLILNDIFGAKTNASNKSGKKKSGIPASL